MNSLEILNGLRVLLVDDNADDLELNKFALEQHNVQVTAVTSAHEAFNEITLLKPNILICDLEMPLEDGYSLISKIRNLAQPLSKVPAIALTTYLPVKVPNQVIDAGFSIYLTKPFDPDELIAVVSNLAVRHSTLCCANKKYAYHIDS